MMYAVLIGVSTRLGTMIVIFIIVPWLRIQYRRRQSRRVKPRADQIWIQEGAYLIVKNVNQHGIELTALDGQARETWFEPWHQWHQRLKINVCYLANDHDMPKAA